MKTRGDRVQDRETLTCTNRDATVPRVLVATSLGGFQQGALVESVLAQALALRGAEVSVLLCDSALPACQLTKIESALPDRLAAGWEQPRCATCQPAGEDAFMPAGVPVLHYSEYLTSADREEARTIAADVPWRAIGDYTLDGLAAGEHAVAGALRYYGRGDLEAEPLAESILRRYLASAVLTLRATQHLLDAQPFDVAVFNHGIYVPQGLIGEVCRQRGVRVVNWNPAYRKHCFIFSHGDSYHHTMLSEPVSVWEHIPWKAEIEKQTMDYLQSRVQGTGDWIWFHEQAQERKEEIERAVGCDLSKPSVALLTNVMWDAQLHFGINVFPNMLVWVLDTIRYFANRPDVQLVIRVHPAEVRGSVPSRQPIAEEIRKAFPRLPPNVFVVPSESRVSTYALVEQCSAAIIYGTKTGMEIASVGIPVIVAGEAWIRGKGFSLDAHSPEEYRRLLDRLPLPARLNAEQMQRARKYAFHFFFRRMIPLPFIEPAEKFVFRAAITGPGDLTPGRYPGLDVICDGILDGKPFVYPGKLDAGP